MLVDGIDNYAIFMLDPNGHVVTWNTGAAKIKGYAAHEIVGSHFSVFYTDEAVARGWPAYELEEAAAHGRFEDDGWRVRQDGSVFWANVVITALRDASGQLKGYAKITRDLSERRRQSEALRQSEERFRLLLEGVEGYAICMLDANGVITGWNTGASQITGYRRDEAVGSHVSLLYPASDLARSNADHILQRARQGGRSEEEGWRQRRDGTLFWAHVTVTAVYADDDKLRGYVSITRDMIDRQISHLSRLVDDLLDIGRITSGKIDLRLAEIDLRTVIERSIESSRFHFDARRQRIACELPAEPLVVKGDMTRLVQVVHNLLHNASKFSPPGCTIEVAATKDAKSATIMVCDPGQGIPEHALDAIFQLFVQEGRTTNPTESGLGIGLTLCRSLVQLHGGAISAASGGLHQGSTFTVQLPLAEPAPRRRPASGSTLRAADSKRILVLDDNRDSADSLAMLLELKGHQAKALYSAEAALRLAPSFQPHVVFMDLSMPGMDGFEALAALKALPQLAAETTFIAMTGYGQEQDRQRTTEAGFDLHLVKPVDITQLGYIVDSTPNISFPSKERTTGH
ncbi:MAG: PAS domain S-box protein [Pigmentiphaga sp.]|nr:PAS domain S-box protein [Pigmentiphaga sp.]